MIDSTDSTGRLLGALRILRRQVRRDLVALQTIGANVVETRGLAHTLCPYAEVRRLPLLHKRITDTWDAIWTLQHEAHGGQVASFRALVQMAARERSAGMRCWSQTRRDARFAAKRAGLL